MSEYKEYLEEVEKLDALLTNGYQIVSINENLSGMFIDFEKNSDKKQIQLVTADARKYISLKIIQMSKETTSA
jgi:hypothetical protein